MSFILKSKMIWDAFLWLIQQKTSNLIYEETGYHIKYLA